MGQEIRFRLFCLGYSGGTAGVYHRWAQRLPVEVVPLELPGHMARLREPLLDSVDQMAEDVLRQVTPSIDRPFGFFGHSLGAIVAYEAAHRLRELFGVEPGALWLSGRSAPGLTPRTRPLHGMADDRRFLREVAALGGISDEVAGHAELVDLVLPILRADFQASETHAPRRRERLECAVTVLAGQADPLVPPSDVEPWQMYTRGRFRMHTFEGDHFFLHGDEEARLLEMLASELRELLEATPKGVVVGADSRAGTEAER